MAYGNKGNSLPNRLIPFSQKLQNEYALQVCRSIYQSFASGSNSYYERRNRKFARNRLYSMGRQPVEQLLDRLDIDAKEAFINVNFTPTPIAPKYKNVCVNKFMNEVEKIVCNSLNRDIVERKKRKKIEAEFAVENKDFMNQVQGELQTKLVPDEVMGMSSKEEVDFYTKLTEGEREEIAMQKMVNFVLSYNDIETLKKQLLNDVWDTNLLITRDYFDNNGVIRVETVRPEAFVYSSSFKADLTDSQYHGHILQYTVSQARVMFPHVDEKTWYDVATSSSRYWGNDPINYVFNTRYYTDYNRPYDDVTVKMMFVWYPDNKEINFVEGVDSYGRKIFDIQEKVGELKNPKKKSGTKQIETALTGYYILNTDIVLNWGEEKYQLRPCSDLEKVKSPYSIYMPNNDGSMEVPSIQEMINASIEGMDECMFKIRQIMALAAPDGYLIDIDGLNQVDLGMGSGSLSPLELVTIRRQTGDTYYRSRDEQGNPLVNPIQYQQTSFGSKLNELINVYNFHLNNIRGITGINEYAEGSSVNPRLGSQVLNTQLATSNNAISHLYNGYLSVLKSLSINISNRCWDLLYAYTSGEAPQYFIDMMGKENYDVLHEARDIIRYNYDMDVKVSISQEDRAKLNQRIETALSSGQITFTDSVFIETIDDYKMAILYLEMKAKKNQREQQDAVQQQQQAQAEMAQQQIQLQAQNEQQLVQMKGTFEVQSKQVTSEGELDKAKKQFLYDMLKANYETGKPLPPYVEMLLAQDMAETANQNKMLAKTTEAIDEQLHQEELAQLDQQEQELKGQLGEEGMEEYEMEESMGGEEQQMQPQEGEEYMPM